MRIKERLLIFALSAAVLVFSCRIEISAEEPAGPIRCYVLTELSTGTVIYGKNQDKPVPVGTMNKLMTVLLVAESIEEGKLSLETQVKTSAAANSMQGAQIWLMPGEEMSLEDLLKGIIIGNANDASVAAAEAVAGTEEAFVELMNRRAEELGMEKTSFTNCSGYYNDSEQISTAYEISVLCGELYKHDFLREYFTCWLDYLRGGATELVNSNVLVKSFDGIAGFKAGFTECSGHCAAAAAERDGTAFAAVLIGYDDKDDMFYGAKQLLNDGFSGYCVITPPLPENLPEKIAVRGGVIREISVKYGEARNIVIPNGANKSVSSAAIIPDYVFAPVKKGDKIGEIHFYKDDKFIFSSDITAEESAGKLGILRAMVILLKNLVSF